MPTDDDSVTSRTVEETNELRKKLGLKPLITQESEPKPEPESSGQDTGDVVERLNRVRNRRARESLIKGEGIADTIKKGESISSKRKKFGLSKEDEDTLDLLAWSKRMGAVSKTSIARAEKEVTYSDDEEDAEDGDAQLKADLPRDAKTDSEGSKVKVLHKMKELDLVKGDGVVLTLKDVGVLEAEAAGVADVDFLENADLVDMKRDRKNFEQRMRNQYGNYVPYEEEDLVNPGFLKHYDDKIKETQGLKLSSLVNEDDGFFIKINDRAAVDDEPDLRAPSKGYDTLRAHNPRTELIDESDVFSSFKSKKEKLRKKPKQMNWDKILTKDDGVDLDLTNIVPTRIKKDVSKVEDDDEDQLYTKIASHRMRKSSLEAKCEPSEPTSAHVDFDLGSKDKAVEITATTEFCKVLKTPQEKISEQESEPKYKIPAPTVEKDDDPNTLSEVPLGDGISAALSYIKQRGDFIDKKANVRSTEVQLNYLDSYGNEMTPKEAFRQISWIFHGKKPSMNKLERKARRMERERLARQNPAANMPTMRALFTHQSNEDSAHLILTGNTNNN